MSNHLQQPERGRCVEVPPTPGEVVNHIARAAYTEGAIIASSHNTCDDILPDYGFSPVGRHEQKQAYVRECAAPLFEGSPPLIAYLDRSSYKGEENREFDGRVSAHNMKDFLKTYETMKETGQSQWPYTDGNAQYVRDLLDFKYPELTGPNFAGFSARALCRRAGLTKVNVKDYDGYAALAVAWKQATSEAPTFSEDVAASRANATPDVPCAPPTQDAPKVQPPAEVPCEVPPKPPCDTPPAPPPVPCEVAPKLVVPCDPPQPPSPCDGDRVFKSRIDEMSTFHKGDTYWGMAKHFLHAGMKPGDRDDISNRDIHQVTRSFLELNHAHVNDKGLPVPMCHPGDRVPVSSHLEELARHHEKLARALERMLSAEQ